MFFRERKERTDPILVRSFYVQAVAGIRSCMTATVFLARHGSHSEVGHVLSGRSEIGLSPAGRAEAGLLAERLAATSLGAIHSSPRRRALETAAIVAERQALPVQVADALDEIDFGTWSGKSFAELEADPEWREWNASRATAATPAGETMSGATARIVSHIEAIEPQAGPLLCVSHCDVIRGIVAHYLGLEFDRLLAFDIDPASLTTLALHDGGGRVVSLNERMG